MSVAQPPGTGSQAIHTSLSYTAWGRLGAERVRLGRRMTTTSSSSSSSSSVGARLLPLSRFRRSATRFACRARMTSDSAWRISSSSTSFCTSSSILVSALMASAFSRSVSTGVPG